MPIWRVVAAHLPAITCFHCCVKDPDVQHKVALLRPLPCVAILFRRGWLCLVDLLLGKQF
jgi:hypothetical protein